MRKNKIDRRLDIERALNVSIQWKHPLTQYSLRCRCTACARSFASIMWAQPCCFIGFFAFCFLAVCCHSRTTIQCDRHSTQRIDCFHWFCSHHVHLHCYAYCEPKAENGPEIKFITKTIQFHTHIHITFGPIRKFRKTQSRSWWVFERFNCFLSHIQISMISSCARWAIECMPLYSELYPHLRVNGQLQNSNISTTNNLRNI